MSGGTQTLEHPCSHCIGFSSAAGVCANETRSSCWKCGTPHAAFDGTKERSCCLRLDPGFSALCHGRLCRQPHCCMAELCAVLPVRCNVGGGSRNKRCRAFTSSMPVGRPHDQGGLKDAGRCQWKILKIVLADSRLGVPLWAPFWDGPCKFCKLNPLCFDSGASSW